MFNPVDTDALRDVAWEKYAALNGIHPHSIERDTFEQGWDAAADEVDRLRSRVVELEAMVVATSTDRRRLRTVIENAPHDDGCKHVDWVDGLLQLGECTCWKADAL